MTGTLEVYIATNYIESIHTHRSIESCQTTFKNPISDIQGGVQKALELEDKLFNSNRSLGKGI